jgi:drug/metabolite transporter (DMT)-like permease
VTAHAPPIGKPAHQPFTKRQCFALVFVCTLFGAAAQILIKAGATHLTGPGLLAMVTNWQIMAGYSLYGMSTVVLIFALRDGELSLLYPVIALTYVWVTVASFAIFHETISPYKLLGILTIVAGVGVLGRSGRK